MKLPPDVQERLAKEYRFIATKIREETEPLRKGYFFSALFTEISRILNWHWDRDLVLLHWVLQATHSNLVPRMQPSSPAYNARLAKLLSERLAKVVEDLAVYMEKGAKEPKLYELIGRVAEIGYLSTNHGGYVIEKGLVQPDAI